MWRWFIAGALAWAAFDVAFVWAWSRIKALRTPSPHEEWLDQIRRSGF